MGCRLRFLVLWARFLGLRARFPTAGSRFPARFSATTAVCTCLLQKNFGQKTPGWQDLTTNQWFTTVQQQVRMELQSCLQQIDQLFHVLPVFHGHIPAKTLKIVKPER